MKHDFSKELFSSVDRVIVHAYDRFRDESRNTWCVCKKLSRTCVIDDTFRSFYHDTSQFIIGKRLNPSLFNTLTVVGEIQPGL